MTRTTQQVLTSVECRCVLLWLAQALLTYICQLSGLLAVQRRLHVRYMGCINISNLSRTCVPLHVLGYVRHAACTGSRSTNASLSQSRTDSGPSVALRRCSANGGMPLVVKLNSPQHSASHMAPLHLYSTGDSKHACSVACVLLNCGMPLVLKPHSCEHCVSH